MVESVCSAECVRLRTINTLSSCRQILGAGVQYLRQPLGGRWLAARESARFLSPPLPLSCGLIDLG